LITLAVVEIGEVLQQMFPSTDGPAILVDLTLPQKATIADT
jgi:multidrug efflux pump subunit AcrB